MSFFLKVCLSDLSPGSTNRILLSAFGLPWSYMLVFFFFTKAKNFKEKKSNSTIVQKPS